MRTFKKRLALFLALLFLVGIQSVGYAAESTPLTKLGRGMGNVATSPAEYVINYNKVFKKDGNLVTATAAALFQGTFSMFQRAGSGFWDMLTFPFGKEGDFPSSMEPINFKEEWY